jgi:hypothetical protein
MGKYYHLFLETPRANLSQVMHHINGSYITYYNVKRRYARHLFQGRYHGIVVEADAYALQLSRYIHLNPPLRHSKEPRRLPVVKLPCLYRLDPATSLANTEPYPERRRVLFPFRQRCRFNSSRQRGICGEHNRGTSGRGERAD